MKVSNHLHLRNVLYIVHLQFRYLFRKPFPPQPLIDALLLLLKNLVNAFSQRLEPQQAHPHLICHRPNGIRQRLHSVQRVPKRVRYSKPHKPKTPKIRFFRSKGGWQSVVLYTEEDPQFPGNSVLVRPFKFVILKKHFNSVVQPRLIRKNKRRVVRTKLLRT